MRKRKDAPTRVYFIEDLERLFPVGSYVEILVDPRHYAFSKAGKCARVTSHRLVGKNRLPKVFYSQLGLPGSETWGSSSPDHLRPCTEEDWVASRMIQELGR
jgi:hypothetical protein